MRQFEEPLVIDLCGRSWSLTEKATRANPADPHDALLEIALKRGLATFPNDTTASDQAVFAKHFRDHAKRLNPDWPFGSSVSTDGAMDDALNAGFADSIRELHAKGALLDVDPDDCDFGSVAEDWERAAADALTLVGRPALVKLLAPSEGARQLSRRSYRDLGVAELAEDLSAWTNNWHRPHGSLKSHPPISRLALTQDNLLTLHS